VGDIDFKVISAIENSNKFHKNQVLGRKNQLRKW
jgi:competence transcription factor ComK